MTENKVIPKLRFKEFEGAWSKLSLDEISIVNMGQSPSSKSYNQSGEGVLLIQGNADIKDRLTNPRQWTSEPSKKCKIGDLILTVRAPVGTIAKSKHNACIGRGVCSISNNSKSDIEYLYQALVKYEKKWVRLEQGSTFTAVSGNDIRVFKIGIPSIAEQQKIAEFLSSVDKKIQLLRKKKEQLELYKKGVMQKIFSREIRFKDENGNSYPDWEEKKLEDICYKTSSNLSASDCETDSGEYPVYGASGICTFISSFDLKEDYIAIVKDGSGVGNLIYCVSNSSVIGTMDVLRTRQNNDLKFLYYFLQTVRFKKFKVGSSIPHIYFRDYRSLKKLTPNNNEQKKIANFLSSIDKKIDTTSTQIDKTKEFKKGLLQQMFV